MLPPPNGHIRARERSVRSPALLATSIAAIAVVVGCQAPTPELNVTLSDYAFDPKQLSLTPGQKAVLVLQNKGTVEHNLDIPELKLDLTRNLSDIDIKLGVFGRVIERAKVLDAELAKRRF